MVADGFMCCEHCAEDCYGDDQHSSPCPYGCDDNADRP